LRVLVLSKDYSATIDEGENIPEELASIPMTVRQRGHTIIYRGRTAQYQASTQNNHLVVNEDYFEVEVSEFGSEETHLIKVIRTEDN
jgi:hypothetical protein